MGIGLFITVLIMLIVLFILTFIEDDGRRQVISSLLTIIFMVFLYIYDNSIGNQLPKYHINDKVQLPDNTWGNIDSVAYKVEGVWYNQEVLKD